MKRPVPEGLRITKKYTVPADKVARRLMPESRQFQTLPEMLATGYLCGLIEWTCMELVETYLDDGDHTIGVQMNLTQAVPTPPGVELEIVIRYHSIEGRRLRFQFTVRDSRELISEGTHERYIVNLARLEQTLAQKRPATAAPQPARPAEPEPVPTPAAALVMTPSPSPCPRCMSPLFATGYSHPQDPEEILVCSECGTFASRDPAWGPASPVTSAYVARHYPGLWEAWKRDRKAQP